MSIIREKLEQLQIDNLMAENQIIDDVVSYFDRRTDHAAIKNAIKVRYGLGIKQDKDPNNASAVIETYVKGGWSLQVDSGLIEAITVGFGQKVVGALSNLFTENGQKLSFVHDDENRDLEDIDTLMNRNREAGGFGTAIINADKRAIQTGSCAILVNYSGGQLNYETFVPSAVRFYYPEYIIEEGTGQRRAPTHSDIEDCYAVVVRVSQRNTLESNFLGIMGRSIEYPQGRYVEFSGKTTSVEIPEVGDSSIVSEYMYQDAPANPLSVKANEMPDAGVPEYPIAIVLGSITDDSTPMPSSTSLYQDCIEFDLAASHTLSASQEAARGCDVLSIDQEGVSQPLPRSLSGNVVTNPGQNFEHVSKNAEDPEKAFDTLKKMMVENAMGRGVPDYIASSEDHALGAESGRALEVKTRPLIKERNRRITVNQDTVRRLFDIEKFLLFAHEEGEDAVLSTLIECRQVWQPGEIKLPESKLEKVERIGSALEKGLIDTIGAFKEYYDVATDDEAIEIYEKMKERSVEYPSLAPKAETATAAKKFGISTGAANLGITS